MASWIELDSTDPEIRLCSELALRQEVDWARHISLPGVLFPCLPKGNLFNTARALNDVVSSTFGTQVYVKVPLADKNNLKDNLPWKQWNRLRTLTEYNPKIQVALEITSQLPPDEQLLDMWVAEPIRLVIVPGEVFVPNSKGYPVLPKPHQKFIQKLMDKMKPDIVVTIPDTPLHKSATSSSYCDYIRYLNRNLRPLTSYDIISAGFQDYIQIPLQPLMDNLENQTYETFESDPVKYQLYEKAVYKALLDKVEHQSNYVT